DANFRAYVLANFDTDSDGILTMEEAAAVTEMNYRDSQKQIFELTGIEYFTGLEIVDITSQKYDTADFTYNTNLKEVTVGYGDALETVNVSTCSNLEHLSVMGSSSLTTLDISNNTNLTRLVAYNTGLSTIDLQNNTKLTSLSLTGPNLTGVDLSMLTELTTLSVGGDAMTSVDLANNVNLTSLTVSGKNITELDITKNTKLQTLSVANSGLTALDVTQCRDLRRLTLDFTSIAVLDLSNCLKLTYVSAYQDFALTTVWLATGQTIDSTMGISEEMIKYKDAVAPADITANAVDANFRTYLLENFDTNGDNALSDEEAANIIEIDITGMGITSIDGVEYFFMPNITVLKLADNELTSLDLVSFKKLEELYCSNNQIAGEMDLDTNAELRIFQADHNQLESIRGFGDKTESVIANDNQLTTAVVYFCGALKEVNVANNQLTSFDCRENPMIISVNISNNPGITSWLVWSMPTLENINISNTGITEFKTFGSASNGDYGAALKTLNCSGTKLSTLDVSGNTSLEVLDATNCANLTSINVGSVNITDLKADEGVEIIKDGTTPGGDGLAIDETNFPDETFRTYVAENFDTNEDGALSDSEIAAAEVISLKGTDQSNTITVTSLEGIKNFTALKELTLKNVAGLSTINVDDMTTLETMRADAVDGLTTYSVNNCSNLILFRYNPFPFTVQVSEIDISTCPNLVIDPNDSQGFYVSGDVDILWVSAEQKDAVDYWMMWKEIIYYYDIEVKVKENSTPAGDGLAIDATNFPDETFRNYVSTNFDTNSDGALSEEEIAAATVISLVGTDKDNTITVTSLEGIENFTALKELTIKFVKGLTTINMDGFTTLETMNYDASEGLTSYSVNGCTNLVWFRYYAWPFNSLVTEIDLSTCPNINFDYDKFYIGSSMSGTVWVSADQLSAATKWFNDHEYYDFAQFQFKTK
ncbi:leucine-rich repeat domain-containing protein, partial [uncultured Alistipes sp.]|uniref:leucine-rich repeat domain-containing protein n=1 Tax=uncultured Alistipes sp. TaxID=538949 RepID=UPI00345C4B05